jgi:nitroreductase
MTQDRKSRARALFEAICARRSVRRFAPGPIDNAALDRALEVLPHSPSAGGRRAWELLVVRSDTARRAMKKAAFAGIRGKINPWIAAQDIPAFAVLVCRPADALRKGDKDFSMLDASVGFESFVLAASEAGLGTCWIGGFEEDAVRRELGLPAGSRVPAFSPVGAPHKGAPSLFDIASFYDNASRREKVKDRKATSEILFLDRFGAHITPPLRESVLDAAPAMSGPGAVAECLRGLKLTSSFSNKSVPREQLAWLIESARLAPSASNSQTWRFVLVEDDDARRRLEGCATDEDGRPVPFRKAPALIALVADFWLMNSARREQPFFMIDIPIALTHILLAASAFGLSANVNLTFNENRARGILGAPALSRVVAFVTIGHPSRAASGDVFPIEFLVPKAGKHKEPLHRII